VQWQAVFFAHALISSGEAIFTVMVSKYFGVPAFASPLCSARNIFFPLYINEQMSKSANLLIH
jgi:hypothetical protein